jgi:hypothetical protein
MESEQVGSSPDGAHDSVVAAEAGSTKFQNSTPEEHYKLYTRIQFFETAGIENAPWCWYPSDWGIIVGTLGEEDVMIV